MPRFPRITLKLAVGWRRVLRHAWSVRLLLLAALLNFLDALLTLAGATLPFPPLTIAILTGLVTSAALVARIVVQKDLSE